MRFSAPIYVLKRKAKLLSRDRDVALHRALDKIATDEGFQNWSHLISSKANEGSVGGVLSKLDPGDLVLVGARPRQGKTLLGLELAASASQLKRKGYFFTLDYHKRDLADRFSDIGIAPSTGEKLVVLDTSDDVSADYVIHRLKAVSEPVLIVLDYLQLLDQKRTNPSLDDQIKSLQRYAMETGAICVVISQIDRSFDLGGKPIPDVSDIRLPNPLDLSVFRKLIFLHEGKIRFERAA